MYPLKSNLCNLLETFMFFQCSHPAIMQLTNIRQAYFCVTYTNNAAPDQSVQGLRDLQSELPRPILWKSVESDLGCTSRMYFDNVTLTLHNVTLTSQKPCQHNNLDYCFISGLTVGLHCDVVLVRVIGNFE